MLTARLVLQNFIKNSHNIRTFANMPVASKKALIVFAPGAEETETVSVVDVLRNGGVDVTIAGLPGKEPIPGKNNVIISPDTSLDEALRRGLFDAIILPGGEKAAEKLCNSQQVGEALRSHESDGRIVGAICAGPTVLKAHGIGRGRAVTCVPKSKDLLQDYQYREDPVVQDGNLITSRGPGTALEFGFKLLECLEGAQKAKEVRSQLIF